MPRPVELGGSSTTRSQPAAPARSSAAVSRRRRARGAAPAGSVRTAPRRPWRRPPAAGARPPPRSGAQVGADREVEHLHDPVVAVLAADQLADHLVQHRAGDGQLAPPGAVPQRVHVRLGHQLDRPRLGHGEGATAGEHEGGGDVPAAPGQVRGDRPGRGVQQRRRPRGPAGVRGDLAGQRCHRRRVQVVGDQHPVVLARVAERRVEHRQAARAPRATPRPRRTGTDTASARARAAASSGVGSAGSGPGRHGTTPTTAAVGSGPYRCGNRMPAGSPGTPGSSAHRVGEPGGVDHQQDDVAPAGEQPLRRQVHLLGRRQVHEPGVGQRRRGERAGRRAVRHSGGVVRCSRTGELTPASQPHGRDSMPGDERDQPGRRRPRPHRVARVGGRRPVDRAVAGGPAVRPGAARRGRPAQRRSTGTATGPSRRSSRTWTPAGTPSTSRSRTSSTT